MEGRLGGVVAILALALVISRVAFVTEGATPDCSALPAQLVGCLSFVTGVATTPQELCCQELAPVAVSEPVCLCEIIGYGNVTLPAGFNVTLAEELPALCNISLSPSDCPALIAGSPAGAPSVPQVPIGPVPGQTAGGPAPPPASSSAAMLRAIVSSLAAATVAGSLIFLVVT